MVTWLVLFAGFEWLKPFKVLVVVSIGQKNENEKNERKTESHRGPLVTF